LNRKILITGGTGFIGYHLAKKCLEFKWSVTSLSTKKPKKARKLNKVKYIFCDISNKKKLNKKLKPNFDYVVNLAGYVDHSHKKKTIKSHYNGCKNLSSIFLKTKIKKFIQIGSSVEYGKVKSPQFENKKNRQKSFSTYGSAKLLSTKHLLTLQKKFNFPATIIRLYLVYGPNQEKNRVIPITITNAIKNKKFDCSDGSQLRDFIHVEDVVNAIIKTLKVKKTSGEIINIGTGNPVTIKSVIKQICNLVRSGTPQFGKISLRKDETMKLYPNIFKATKLLGWKPKIKLLNGLKETINHYKKNNE
jgi:nucleoside-diphosphate-sugar epimerase